jgi:hypothetical protein
MKQWTLKTEAWQADRDQFNKSKQLFCNKISQLCTCLAGEDRGHEGRYIAHERLANNDTERLPGCSERWKPSQVAGHSLMPTVKPREGLINQATSCLIQVAKSQVKPSSSSIPCLALRRLNHTYLLSSFTTTVLQCLHSQQHYCNHHQSLNTNRSPCCHHHCRQCRVICCMLRSHHHNCRVYSCVWVLWYEHLCCQCVLWVLTSSTMSSHRGPYWVSKMRHLPTDLG